MYTGGACIRSSAAARGGAPALRHAVATRTTQMNVLFMGLRMACSFFFPSTAAAESLAHVTDSAERIALGLVGFDSPSIESLILIRLLGSALILAAIVDKNRGKST